MLLVIGVLLFISLVVVHEFGHFWAARRNGVVVEEFGIGFPPKIWAKKMRSGFLLSFNLLPLGGFVRLKGEHDASKALGSFGAASLPAKAKIMMAGVGMNLLTAFILFTLLALTGLPKLIDGQFSVNSDAKIIRQTEGKNTVLIGQVLENSPAKISGLEAGDQLISIADKVIETPEAVGEITKSHAGEQVTIIVRRGTQEINFSAQLNSTRNSQDGYLGVSVGSGEHGIEVVRYTWSAPIVSLGLIKQFSVLTYQGIATVFSSLAQGDTQKASEQVAGPVGVFVLLKDSTALGFSVMLMIIAVISLTLAIMNILPIPALDGGRLFVTLLFRLLHRPLAKEREEIIHAAGFILLMALFLLITVVDIKRNF